MKTNDAKKYQSKGDKMNTDYDDLDYADYMGRLSDYGHDEYLQEQYEEELIENAIKNISNETVKKYLGKNGDAIEERVSFCIKEANNLIISGHLGSSLVLSATAIELIIRFFLLRPLVQGAFLSDEWADVLSNRVVGSRYAEDKKLLPAILKNRGIDIIEEKTSNGNKLWEVIHGKVWRERHKFVHQATPVREEDAQIALDCANALIKIVNKIANDLGFTRKTTGKWSLIKKLNHEGLESAEGFSTENPFKD